MLKFLSGFKAVGTMRVKSAVNPSTLERIGSNFSNFAKLLTSLSKKHDLGGDTPHPLDGILCLVDAP